MDDQVGLPAESVTFVHMVLTPVPLSRKETGVHCRINVDKWKISLKKHMHTSIKSISITMEIHDTVEECS